MVVQEQVNIVMADLNSELAALMNDLAVACSTASRQRG